MNFVFALSSSGASCSACLNNMTGTENTAPVCLFLRLSPGKISSSKELLPFEHGAKLLLGLRKIALDEFLHHGGTKKGKRALRLLDEILRYVEPVREGRSDNRKMRTQSAVDFIYRVA